MTTPPQQAEAPAPHYESAAREECGVGLWPAARLSHHPDKGELLRATLFHSPGNPFVDDGALRAFMDGGLAIRDGRILDCGDYADMQDRHPDMQVVDLRGGFLLPGFIDTHVHFPQLRVLGSLGHSLLDWLRECALPEEARMANECYAGEIARHFLHALAAHGTTTALTFGAHFVPAMTALFETAKTSGLRIVSGLVVSDRNLRDELHQSPKSAYEGSSALIRAYHGRGRLLYAVTPRFALSTSEAMLEVCQTLMRENPGVRFQTHLNENPSEIAAIAEAFPWAQDYLAVYERYGLCGRGSVMAHSVHTTDEELKRLTRSETSVAHCPASNAALGSGIFPLRRHLNAGVRFAMGTDVGGGTGYGMLKEGLQAYLMQRVASDPMSLSAAHLLYLATRAGAEALNLQHEIGDFEAGKAADFVYLRPPEGSPLAAVVETAESPERLLSALFTMAGSENVREVRVEGSVVHRSDDV